MTSQQPSASKIAQNVGTFFFNILRLDCVHPVYPKICLESTIYHRLGRFLNWGVSSPSQSEIVEGCSRWEEDLDADPIDIKFFKPTKSF